MLMYPQAYAHCILMRSHGHLNELTYAAYAHASAYVCCADVCAGMRRAATSLS
jgi:hypothetical protein